MSMKSSSVVCGVAAMVVAASAGMWWAAQQPNVLTQEKVPPSELIPEPKIVSAEPPVILVHGFNQTAKFWSDIDLLKPLERKKYETVARLELSSGKLKVKSMAELERGDSAVYLVDLPERGTVDIEESAAMMKQVVDLVCAEQECEQVRLVGFSLGGVACRDYLCAYLGAHRTQQLITISSPHLGSEHAWLAQLYKNIWYTKMRVDRQKPSNFIATGSQKLTSGVLWQTLNGLEKLANQAHIDLECDAARMLLPPRDSNYLYQLNRKSHPQDVDYHCVLTEENVMTYHWSELGRDWEKIRKKKLHDSRLVIATADFTRQVIGKLSMMQKEFKQSRFRGDGVVALSSQNLNNIHAFENSDKLSATTTKVESVHAGSSVRSVLADLLLGGG